MSRWVGHAGSGRDWSDIPLRLSSHQTDALAQHAMPRVVPKWLVTSRLPFEATRVHSYGQFAELLLLASAGLLSFAIAFGAARPVTVYLVCAGVLLALGGAFLNSPIIDPVWSLLRVLLVAEVLFALALPVSYYRSEGDVPALCRRGSRGR